MRNEICKVLIDLAQERKFAFLTGDLGFMALEPLRSVMGNNFINAGISEQNMVSVAAGIAYAGVPAFVYSIAPFCYARPFEQIRNDVCLNKLPVKIIGNGGGYAYGSMGGTHHALEDYGALSTLPGMHCFVPAFASDVEPIVERMFQISFPAYLRLGKCELPVGFVLPIYSAWRCLLKGGKDLLVCMGPFVGGILAALSKLEFEDRPELWVVTELPLTESSIPAEFVQRLQQVSKLYVAEEHVRNGGFGQNLLSVLHENRYKIPEFEHIYARGYPSATYGSQVFHREQCGLDPESILERLGKNIDE